jgi:hypothetical protein
MIILIFFVIIDAAKASSFDVMLFKSKPFLYGGAAGLVIAPIVAVFWMVNINCMAILSWWLKRGQRWDGQGDLFNFTVVLWFGEIILLGLDLVFSNFLSSYKTVVGVILNFIYLYWFWVCISAPARLISKVSRGYSIAGTIVANAIIVLPIAVYTFIRSLPP